MADRSSSILKFILVKALPPLAVGVLIVVLWHVLVVILQPKSYVFCGPMDVLQAIQAEPMAFFWPTFYTTRDMLIAFVLAALAGILIALLLSSHRLVERALYPYMIFFQTVPLVAIAVLLVLWIENSHAKVIVCAFIAAIFPMITNVLQGIHSIPKHEHELFQLYHASLTDRVFKLILPGAMPNIIAGMRIMAGLASIGTITGEYVVGGTQDDKGLGMMIRMGETAHETTGSLFAAIILASLIGLVMLFVINVIGHLLLAHWQNSQR